jgi:hypothetical protein
VIFSRVPLFFIANRLQRCHLRHFVPPESEPDLLESSAAPLLSTGPQHHQQQQTTSANAPAVSKGLPPRPAFEIQYNTETDGGGAGGPAVRSAPSFAPTGGAFRLIEVSATSGVSPPQKDMDIKVRSANKKACLTHLERKRTHVALYYIVNMKLYLTQRNFCIYIFKLLAPDCMRVSASNPDLQCFPDESKVNFRKIFKKASKKV